MASNVHQRLGLRNTEIENCWLCEAMFKSKSLLHKHLASEAHLRLAVHCPWCREKRWPSISDLETHVTTVHLNIKLSKDCFSRSNGFYFAIHPEDYAKIVGTVTNYSSNEARAVRKAMRTWAGAFADGRIDRLNNGWKVADNDAAGKERTRSSERMDSRSVLGSYRNVGGDSRGDMPRRVLDRRKKETVAERGVVKRRQIINERTENAKQSRIRNDTDVDELALYEDNIEIGDEEVVKDKTSEMNINADLGIWRKNDEIGDRQGLDRSDRDSLRVVHRYEVNDSGDSDGDIEPEDVVEEGKMQAELNKISSKISPPCSVYGYNTEGSGRGEELREKARTILKRGAMPLCYPARRDWASVTELNIKRKRTNIRWPPTNWGALTPDQKLMEHEQAAFRLEKGSMTDFPSISRKALLEKYNFLTLEGERHPREEEEGAEKIVGKIRHYNYSYIMDVMKGEIPDSPTAWCVIRSLESTDRWTDTDEITNKLDLSGVKLNSNNDEYEGEWKKYLIDLSPERKDRFREWFFNCKKGRYCRRIIKRLNQGSEHYLRLETDLNRPMIYGVQLLIKNVYKYDEGIQDWCFMKIGMTHQSTDDRINRVMKNIERIFEKTNSKPATERIFQLPVDPFVASKVTVVERDTRKIFGIPLCSGLAKHLRLPVANEWILTKPSNIKKLKRRIDKKTTTKVFIKNKFQITDRDLLDLPDELYFDSKHKVVCLNRNKPDYKDYCEGGGKQYLFNRYSFKKGESKPMECRHALSHTFAEVQLKAKEEEERKQELQP